MGPGSLAGSRVTESRPQEAPVLGQQQERREEAAASELVIPFALKTLSLVCPENLQLHVKSQTLQIQWPRGFGKGTRPGARRRSFS